MATRTGDGSKAENVRRAAPLILALVENYERKLERESKDRDAA